jgi:Fur family ferric uptake transcriptional regulator
MSQGPLEQFEKFLRHRGRNVTETRRKILRAVLSHRGHFDATDIWESLRRERVSIATVYRTLDLLEEAGFVRKVRLGKAHAHYENVLAREDHGHLVCRSCGRVIEFELGRIRASLERAATKEEFALEKVHIQGIGLCPECAQKS